MASAFLKAPPVGSLNGALNDPAASCQKIAYNSREDARRVSRDSNNRLHGLTHHARQAANRRGVPRPYICTRCGSWHLGHEPEKTTPTPPLTEADLDAMPHEGIKRMGIHLFVAGDGAYAVNVTEQGIPTRIGHEFVTDRAIALFEAAVRLRKRGIGVTKQNVRDEANEAGHNFGRFRFRFRPTREAEDAEQQ